MLLLHLGLIAVAALAAASTWHTIVRWLVAQGVLVGADAAMIALPAAGGVGLDGPRLAIAAAGLVFGLFCAATLVRNWFASGEEE